MKKTFDGNNFMIIISLIWGFGFAILLRRFCVNGKCMIYKTPIDFNENQTVFENGNCYKFTKYQISCNQ